VGYGQGNFSSDDCAVGGFTLDYGPFGFCESFDPWFQPWTGGGRHFSFFNQPAAAEANFHTLCGALRPLLEDDAERLAELDQIRQEFAEVMGQRLETMWADKLGLEQFDRGLYSNLIELMQRSRVDYTMFFRALCDLPKDAALLSRTFHDEPSDEVERDWQAWLGQWHALSQEGDHDARSERMKRVNPRYTWREWLVAPAYEMAEHGDFARVKELQELFSSPYVDQESKLAAESDQKRPAQFDGLGGVAHYSCSS